MDASWSRRQWIQTVAAAAGAAAAGNVVSTPEILAQAAAGMHSWPQFRGALRNGVCGETGLLQKWPEGGPKRVGVMEGMGRGFSSPSFGNGMMFLTGDDEDQLWVYGRGAHGEPKWKVPHGRAWTENYPGARATPTFSANKVYVLNAHGVLGCFAAADGQALWSKDVLQEFEAKNITWGLSECVLEYAGWVFATVGGAKASVVALQAESGKVMWQAEPILENGEPDGASYVSPILVDFEGTPLLVGCTNKHLYVVNASTGVLQWKTRFPTTYGVISLMPALVGRSAIFMTAPHGQDGKLFDLKREGDKVVGVERWQTKLDTLQGCVVQTGDLLVGAFYGPRQGWAAVDAATGAVKYQAPEYIKGAGVMADHRLYALSENGVMRLLEVTPDRFIEHGRFDFVPRGKEVWAHPVIHHGKLYLRHHHRVEVFDVRAT